RNQPLVILVVEDEILLTGKVTEERAWRNLGLLSNLFDSGRFIALLQKKPQRMLLELISDLALLALSQACCVWGFLITVILHIAAPFQHFASVYANCHLLSRSWNDRNLWI